MTDDERSCAGTGSSVQLKLQKSQSAEIKIESQQI